MRTLKLKGRPTNTLFAAVNQMFGVSSQLTTTAEHSFRCAQRFNHSPLGSSRKLGGAAEHLFDGSEKRICRLSYEFYSPRVVERCSKTPSYSIKVLKECSSILPPPCE